MKPLKRIFKIITKIIKGKFAITDVLDANFQYFTRNDVECIVLDGYTYTKNFGDALNKPLARMLTSKIIIESCYLLAQPRKSYMLIGSIIHLAEKNSILLGAGCISSAKYNENEFRGAICVRGPRTAEIMKGMGVKNGLVMGDPALLLPKLYRPQIKIKKNKIGVIPHYIDARCTSVIDLLQDREGVLINILCGKDWRGFIDAILECECIVSSSLHGLIASDAYGIPNAWVKFSSNVEGNDFKFHDYYESIGRVGIKPLNFQRTIDNEKLQCAINQWTEPNIDLEALHRAITTELNSIV